MKNTLTFLFALALCGTASSEILYHVSPNGSDAGTGSIEQPFATLTKARDTIRELPEASRRQNIRVLLRGGIHLMSEPLVLNVEDGAPLGLTVSYEAFPGEVPVLDSGAEISGWEKASAYPEGSAGWLKRRQGEGKDLNSVAADPLFTDLENFDFTLQAGSPALERGFKQIPFERIGLLSQPAVERLRSEGKTFSDLLTK